MYMLKNRKLNAVYRGGDGKPVLFHSKEDAAWLIRSWEQNLRDWLLLKVNREVAQ